MNNLNMTQPTYTFNSSGGFDGKNNFKVFLDSQGNLKDTRNRPFGMYNIPIDIQTLIYFNIFYIGLGDIIDFFTKKLYIKNLIMFITKGKCGCEERRKLFNKFLKIPYFIKIQKRRLYFEDHEIIEQLKTARKNKISLIKKTTFLEKDLEDFNKVKNEYDNYFKESKLDFFQSVNNYKKQFKKNNMTNEENKKTTHQPVKHPNENKPKPVNYKEIKGGCGCNKK